MTIKQDYSQDARMEDAETLANAAFVLEKWTMKKGFWLKLMCRLLRSAAKSITLKNTKLDAEREYRRHMR